MQLAARYRTAGNVVSFIPKARTRVTLSEKPSEMGMGNTGGNLVGLATGTGGPRGIG